MKRLRKILLYSLSLLMGLTLFWWLYKDLDWTSLKQGLRITNYYWIAVSITFAMLSNLSRAIRWKMLIKPLGYNPRIINIFLSVLVMYFTNLIIPRAGEVARCTILTRYEKIPATKLIGTMIVERIADLLTLMVLAITVILINFGIVKEFFIKNPKIGENLIRLLSISNIFLGIVVIGLVITIFFLVKPLKHNKFSDKISKLKSEFKQGIKSILRLENRWYFIGHTLLIFLLWLLMLYVVFLAYPPTRHLTIWCGMFTFMMGGLAMLAPVQGGIGAWHYMVIQSLLLFGIDEQHGKIFALLAHTSTNLIYLLFGLIALGLLPLLNRKRKTIRAYAHHEQRTV